MAKAKTRIVPIPQRGSPAQRASRAAGRSASLPGGGRHWPPLPGCGEYLGTYTRSMKNRWDGISRGPIAGEGHVVDVYVDKIELKVFRWSGDPTRLGTPTIGGQILTLASERLENVCKFPKSYDVELIELLLSHHIIGDDADAVSGVVVQSPSVFR